VDRLGGAPVRPGRRAAADPAACPDAGGLHDAERAEGRPRIEVLREQEELDRIRPELSGEDIMAILGIKPGPAVGKAWNHLLELRLDQGELGRDRVTQELLSWASAEGLAGAHPGDDRRTPDDSQ
jgi:hypothetical protein